MTRLSSQEQPRRPRIFYGWWLVLLAGLVLVVATVPLYHAMPVWVLALERHFGWTRTELSIGLTFTRVLWLATPVVGYLSDRFGPRPLVLTGLCILTIGTVLFGLTPNLPGYYAAILIMAVGSSLCGTIPLLVMLSRWFVRRRATAISVLLIAASLGGLILVPVIASSVDSDSGRLGWRLTAFVVGACILAVAVLAVARLRNRPEEMGLLPHGVPPAVQSISFSLGSTLRNRAFWLIAVGDTLTTMAVLAVMTFLGLLMSDMGFAVRDTEWVIAVYTGASMVFHLVGGCLGDRASKRVILAAFAVVQAVGLLVLAFANSLTVFLAFAVLFGAGIGGRGVLSIAILPDYFGTDSLGKILGFSTILASLFLLVASPMTGLFIHWLDGYTAPLVVLAGLSLFGGFLYLIARSPQLSALQDVQVT